jgi:Anti-sigma factor NepR
MNVLSKQVAQNAEPIHERGVSLSVQRTISRGESDPPLNSMHTQSGGFMVKNSPETAVSRAASVEDARAEKRQSPGKLPRSLAAVAAGMGVGANSPENTQGEDLTAGKSGLSLCSSEKAQKKMRNVDFGDVIGKELQSLYDDLVAQPVPDRFLNLLNQLEKNVLSSGMSNGAPGERE